jgi:hypothetical protein
MEIMTLLPLFIFSIIPLAFLGIAIWFTISNLNAQKECNAILKEIAKRLVVHEKSKKEE